MLAGRCVLFAGRLAGLSKRQAQGLVRGQGGTPASRFSDQVQLLVIGEHEVRADETLQQAAARLVPTAAQAVASGAVQLQREAEFWQALDAGSGGETERTRLYTPPLVASLIGVTPDAVRRWLRRGLVTPAKIDRKLPYLDFAGVQACRTLAALAAAGAPLAAVERDVAALRIQHPNVASPLAELPVSVDGKRLLIRSGDQLVEAGGQRRFDFDIDLDADSGSEASATAEFGGNPALLALLAAGAQCDQAGELPRAIEHYRTYLAMAGAKADVVFALAETLYRSGDLSAARERYYMVLELDEDHVEARVNLGCVLTETGDTELAIAAFRGAVDQYPDYPDAHYHLARLLDWQGKPAAALRHWQAFVELAPDSPWVDEAEERLRQAP